MQRPLSFSGTVTSTSGMIASRVTLKWAACPAAALCGLLLTVTTFGDEKYDSGKSNDSDNSAGAQATNCEQNRGAPIGRPVSDDDQRHRAALGVMLNRTADAVSIVEVIPGSPAERAGLSVGDEIRYVGDERIRTTEELTDVIGELTPGTQVDLIIRRNGRRQIVQAELATWESAFGGRALKIESDRTRGPANGAGPQVNASRGPQSYSYKAYAYGPNGGQVRAPQQPVSQRVRALEQQIYRLQQEINQLQFSRQVNRSDAAEMQAWWERVHHGETHNDGALFQ